MLSYRVYEITMPESPEQPPQPPVPTAERRKRAGTKSPTTEQIAFLNNRGIEPPKTERMCKRFIEFILRGTFGKDESHRIAILKSTRARYRDKTIEFSWTPTAPVQRYLILDISPYYASELVERIKDKRLLANIDRNMGKVAEEYEIAWFSLFVQKSDGKTGLVSPYHAKKIIDEPTESKS